MKLNIIKGDSDSFCCILANENFNKEFYEKIKQIEQKQIDKLDKKFIYLYFPCGSTGLSKLFEYNNKFKRILSPEKADYIIFPSYYKKKWIHTLNVYLDANKNMFNFPNENNKNIIKNNVYYHKTDMFYAYKLHENYEKLFLNIESYDNKLCTLSKLLYIYNNEEKGDLNCINSIIENYSNNELLENLSKELLTKNYNDFRFDLCKYLNEKIKISHSLFYGQNNCYKIILKEYFNISDIDFRPILNTILKKNIIFLNDSSKDIIKTTINEDLKKQIDNFIESNVSIYPLEFNYNLETNIKWLS